MISNKVVDCFDFGAAQQLLDGELEAPRKVRVTTSKNVELMDITDEGLLAVYFEDGGVELFSIDLRHEKYTKLADDGLDGRSSEFVLTNDSFLYICDGILRAKNIGGK